MREIRPSGSEGGEAGRTGFPYPYPKEHRFPPSVVDDVWRTDLARRQAIQKVFQSGMKILWSKVAIMYIFSFVASREFSARALIPLFVIVHICCFHCSQSIAADSLSSHELIQRSIEDFDKHMNIDLHTENTCIDKDENGPYKIFSRHSPEYVPGIILKKAQNSILFRIGIDYYRLCRFSNIRITRRPKDNNVHNTWYDDSFLITYHLSIPMTPIHKFPIHIYIDSSGRLLRSLRIPDLLHKSYKINIIERAKAIEITRKHFNIDDQKELNSSLIYNSQYDSFAWLVHTSLKETVDGAIPVTPVLEIIADQPENRIVQKWVIDQE